MHRTHEILIQHDSLRLPAADGKASTQTLATVLSNLVHYGYAISERGYSRLSRCSDEAIAGWWPDVELALAAITGDDKNMADFVVYKNFPREVLDMTQAQYWIKQILMYMGLPNELFTEPVGARDDMTEKPTLRVLHLADEATVPRIITSLMTLPARWTDEQHDQLWHLLMTESYDSIDLSCVPFKENMVRLAIGLMAGELEAEVSSATDVLRLAAGMSDGDVSLRGKTELGSFSRKERKHLLGMLESATNLDEDLQRHVGAWKRLLHQLHPGDYADRYPRVVAAYDKLYRGESVETFNGRVERLLESADAGVLDLLESRPGELSRRLHALILRFGIEAARAYVRTLPRLTTIQLLKMQSYLETINERSFRTFAPKGSWTKLQIVDNDASRRIDRGIREYLLENLAEAIRARVSEVAPSVRLNSDVAMVKLPTSDSELTPYGRGTVFPIPADVTFIRTASYWQSGPTAANIWYDNGWNFFDADWKPSGAVCWNSTSHGKAAVFSGDPTNTKDAHGRACQLIDLYLDKLDKIGVRYAVWNILCYSRRSFNDAAEVYAALQWGVEPQKGELFVPSRCQLAFPLRGDNYTKYVAYIDIRDRRLVYMDANLYGNVGSAAANTAKLSEVMPAFLEYLDALPSVHDLFKHQRWDEEGLPVMYSDADVFLNDTKAYVFRPVNKANTYEPFALSELI